MGIFASANDRQVKKLKKIADKIELLSGKYAAMSNEELQAVTPALRERLQNGETLDDLLPDAFAVCREAAQRVLNMRHYYVQLIGGICLHQGRIAEMATGEGKTLVATLPAYLNALSGKGVHVVTVNDYLARRDAEWMGNVYRFLGLTVGVVVPQQSPEEKKAAYQADITYCTNTELGFDFLRDNMEIHKESKKQRGLNFAIVDEVDSILVDEARTPLIISGMGGKSTELYAVANTFGRTMKPDVDFTIQEKEKTVLLTEDGIVKAQRWFHIENLADMENNELYNHILLALKAQNLMHRDKDYIVSDGEVLIVDDFTGRVLVGRRYSDGLHQAIEAKEGVQVKRENRTIATITYQNFFRMYDKLSGMTGTAKTEEEEFNDIYRIDVVIIPTNLPSRRKDMADKVYMNGTLKNNAIIEDIEECSQRGQPVLVGTVSVEKSEELSKELNHRGIRHNVLNAKNHLLEAEIVAQAGRLGAVTIATNMAGRGTDIMLGGNPKYMAMQKLERDGWKSEEIAAASALLPSDDERIRQCAAEYERHLKSFVDLVKEEKQQVIDLGGLKIIGTERHESRRIDNQLRGRAARQGDPGETVFYIALDDDMMRVFGGERMQSILASLSIDENRPIESGMLSRQIEATQRRVESRNFSVRKNVLAYDDVMNIQREIIYAQRTKVLDGMDVHDQILSWIEPLAQEIIERYADYKNDYNEWNYDEFNGALEQKLLPEGSNVITKKLASGYDVYKLRDAVVEKAKESYEDVISRLKKYSGANIMGIDEIERVTLLKNVDMKWMDHLESMSILREGIGLRGYGQRDPILAYRQEGLEMFEDMVNRIHNDTVSTLMKMYLTEVENPDGTLSANLSFGRPVAPKLKPLKKAKDGTGRNELCPCGSGKKYKNCCGK